MVAKTIKGLTELQRERIKKRTEAKFKTRGYVKGHVARTKGKKISDVPTKKSTAKPKPESELNESQKAARKYARTTAQKAFATGAGEGAQMAKRKKVHDPKGEHKAWRQKHMDKAKTLTGTAKRDKMRQVSNAYRKKIGAKVIKYD